MMFPSLIAPPAGYPSLLRPTPTLTLPQSLQSAFSSHSSFLVEDLIRISRPTSYLPRTAPPPSMSPPTSASRTDSGTPELASSTTAAGSRRICSPQTSSSDSTFLKFGVNAILSSAPRTGKRPDPGPWLRGTHRRQEGRWRGWGGKGGRRFRKGRENLVPSGRTLRQRSHRRAMGSAGGLLVAPLPPPDRQEKQGVPQRGPTDGSPD